MVSPSNNRDAIIGFVGIAIIIIGIVAVVLYFIPSDQEPIPELETKKEVVVDSTYTEAEGIVTLEPNDPEVTIQIPPIEYNPEPPTQYMPTFDPQYPVILDSNSYKKGEFIKATAIFSENLHSKYDVTDIRYTIESVTMYVENKDSKTDQFLFPSFGLCHMSKNFRADGVNAEWILSNDARKHHINRGVIAMCISFCTVNFWTSSSLDHHIFV